MTLRGVARTTRLVFGLADESTRGACSRALAKDLSALSTLVLVRDVDVGLLLPAPGFPSTLPGGGAWRELLSRCADSPGIHRANVPFPDASTLVPAVACVAEDRGAVLILPGVPHVGPRVRAVAPALLPVGAALRAEQHARALEVRLALARDAATEARALASALDLARAEAERLNRELRDAGRRKDEFLAMLGHELRNPLFALLTAIELAGRQIESGGGVKRQLEIMGRQVQHLRRLIDDLLDISRITRGKIELRRERVSLDTVLSRAVETARPFLDQRRHTLTVDLVGEGVLLDADVVRLVQVFGNLLHNAAKFTEPGGHIRLDARPIDSDVEVRVSDDGVGISNADLPHVFEVFVQGPRSLERSQGGLGLGLALVQSLVQMHGGSVSATSDGPGKGTMVTVRLPRVAPQPEVPLPPSPAKRGPGTLPRVLLVEDNPDTAESLAGLLDAWGCEVRVANDGEQAIEEALRYQPEAIVLDISLPGMSGYDVARSVHAQLPTVRLIALSGHGGAVDRANARAAGFDTYLAKPVDLDSLRGALVCER